MVASSARLLMHTENLISRFQSCPKQGHACNDNCVLETSEHLMHAALRHFAEHGLGATRVARAKTETAFFAGDHQAYNWWLAICRILDRRIAAQVDREFDQKFLPAS